MVADDRNIEDILMQVTATYESIRVAMKTLIKKHMEEYITKGLRPINRKKTTLTMNSLIIYTSIRVRLIDI